MPGSVRMNSFMALDIVKNYLPKRISHFFQPLRLRDSHLESSFIHMGYLKNNFVGSMSITSSFNKWGNGDLEREEITGKGQKAFFWAKKLGSLKFTGRC